MKKTIAMLLAVLFMGCATVPVKEPVAEVCKDAEKYVEGLNVILTEYPDNQSAELVYCAELEHDYAYFIYVGHADLEGIPRSGEAHVVVLLMKVNGVYQKIMEDAIAVGIAPEAKMKMELNKDKAPFNIEKDENNK